MIFALDSVLDVAGPIHAGYIGGVVVHSMRAENGEPCVDTERASRVVRSGKSLAPAAHNADVELA